MRILPKLKKEFLNVIQHFENLKQEYVDEVYSTLKKGRDKLQREIANLEDGIFYTEYLETGLEKTKKTTNNTEALMQFIIVKEKIKKAKLQPFRQLQVNVLEEKTTAWTSLLGFKDIANIQLTVSSTRCSYLDMRTVKINDPKKYTLTGAYFVTGLCLSDGRFFAVNKTEAGMCLLFDRKCFVSEMNWKHITWIVEFTEPYNACLCEGEILVTNWESNTIDVVSSTDFHKLRSISLHDNVYGIASWNGCLYVTCRYKILKLDRMGQILKEYNNGIRMLYNRHLVVTSTGIIVYSNSRTNRVKAMTDEGQDVWSYKSDNLQNPLDLDTDFYDNIYVAGNGSRNIHVLSNSGELIRLIDNVPSPLSCKIDEEEGIIYVASGQSVYLYRI